jgi:tRNA threonylcarbamoyladenosine biosynthesis protein TsaB
VRLLALETSTEEGSVALLNGAQLEQRRIPTPREQTDLVLPLVAELLDHAELALSTLDGIAFGRGPGSFTGLRIAAAVAQGLGLASGLPLLPVSTLAATAQRAWRLRGFGHALVCLDARMGEVFWACFGIREGLAEPLAPERLSGPAPVAWAGADTDSWAGVGSGFAAHGEALRRIAQSAAEVLPAFCPSAADLLPRAQADLREGRGQLPEVALPVYLRGEAAWRK